MRPDRNRHESNRMVTGSRPGTPGAGGGQGWTALWSPDPLRGTLIAARANGGYFSYALFTLDITMAQRVPTSAPDAGARRGFWWLGAVSGAYTLSQLIVVPIGLGFSFDETVYVSQVSPLAPAAFFSAPRARGITLLVAPLAAWGAPTWLVRVYLAVLSGAGLLVALWIWRRLRSDRILALAGVLFAGLWVTQFYGSAAMPNLWVAFAGLVAVGCFLRAVRNPGDRVAVVGLGVAAAVAALMRPSDAVWLCAPMLIAAVVRPVWRHLRVLVSLLGGLAVGTIPWVVEAYRRYGGPVERLHQSDRVEGGFGLHFAVLDQLKAQSGRLLCRPCVMGWHHPAASIWLILLPVLVAASLLPAVRARPSATTLMPIICAAAIAIPYLALIDYAAPRFLLPSYALLAIPVADLLVGVVRTVRPARRRALVAALAVCLAAHLAIQYRVLWRASRAAVATSADYHRIADDLRRHGMHPPCLITDDQAIPVAFPARCNSGNATGNNENVTPAQILSAAEHERVAVIVDRGVQPPPYARDWPSWIPAGLVRFRHERVYLSPPPTRP